MRIVFSGLVFGALMQAIPIASAFDYRAYRPANLDDVYAQAAVSCSRDRVVDASTPRYRLDVVWTGQVRPVSAGLATYLEAYRIVVPIGQEIQVSTDTKSYWLPIQDVLVPPLKEEVAPNSRVTLYVTFLGCDPDYVAFTVNEFTAG